MKAHTNILPPETSTVTTPLSIALDEGERIAAPYKFTSDISHPFHY